VALKGLELEVNGLADVHVEIRLCRERAEEDLLDAVGKEALVKEVGIKEAVPTSRIERVIDGLGHCPMVRVVAVEIIEPPVRWVGADDRLGPCPTDDFNDAPAEDRRVDHLPIRLPKEDDLLNPHETSGSALFFLSNPDAFLHGEVFLKTLFAAGH
jgi:hypothetical protein